MKAAGFPGFELAAVAAGLVTMLAILAFLSRDSAGRAAALPPIEDFGLNDSEDAVVELYEHCNYRGRKWTLPFGWFKLRDLTRAGVPNDSLSSLKLLQPAKVTVFEHDKFQGRSRAFTHSRSCLVQDGMNDVLSSVWVEPLDDDDTLRARAARSRVTARGTRLLCELNPLACDGNINIPKKLFFGDKSKSTAPCPNGDCSRSRNNTDPYYVEKVKDGWNSSSLRFTINDDPDESMEVWGNSCVAGDCAGPGTRQHRLRADGNAAHRGSIAAGSPDTSTAKDMWGFDLGVHSRNPSGSWSHLPWKDGVNYLRGDVSVKGTLLTENQNPGPMLETRYVGWERGNRYGIGQYDNGRTRVYAASAETWPNSSVGLGFAQQGGGIKDVIVATNRGNQPEVKVSGRMKIDPGNAIVNQQLPNGWGGGVHTWDVYANATIGVGSGGNVGSFMNASKISAGSSLCVDNNTCLTKQDMLALKQMIIPRTSA